MISFQKVRKLSKDAKIKRKFGVKTKVTFSQNSSTIPKRNAPGALDFHWFFHSKWKHKNNMAKKCFFYSSIASQERQKRFFFSFFHEYNESKHFVASRRWGENCLLTMTNEKKKLGKKILFRGFISVWRISSSYFYWYLLFSLDIISFLRLRHPQKSSKHVMCI